MRTMFDKGVLALLAIVTGALVFSLGPETAAAQDEELSDAEIADLLDEANTEARNRRYRKAIPLYKQVLQAAPTSHANVYYNLAEIKKFLDDCAEARLLYRRYLEVSPKAPDAAAVKKAMNKCVAAKVGKLSINVSGPEDVVVIVGGIPVATKREVEVELKPGKYDVVVRADEHETFRTKIEVLARDDKKVNVELKKITYFGKLTVNVNVKGATVLLDDKELGVSPIEVQQVEAGKHKIEVKLDGYYDWVRNIYVGPSEEFVQDIKLSKLEKKK